MAKVTLKETITSDSSGELPGIGSTAKDFNLVAGDLTEKNLASYESKRKVLNIVPSLDTPVCASSARQFNEVAASLDNTIV